MNLSQTVLGVEFLNPLISSAGKWAWTAKQLQEIVDGGAGGITTKSFSTLTRKGHPDPTVVHTDHYTINAVGLPSDGFEPVRDDLQAFLNTRSIPVIISVFGDTVERFAEASAAFADLKPDALELNISCPNVQDEHGAPFSYAPDTAAAAVRSAREAVPGVKLFVKLSPNVPKIPAIALACAEAGCDGFTLVNTLGPGMAIDLDTRKPILSNKMGGISGAAIKPVAVRCVAEVYQYTDGKLPIIGTGGVEHGVDAIELMMAGASFVGMGTTLLQEGPSAFGRVIRELQHWCEEHGVKDVSELIGTIHHA
jgi:dihydroorotate dehydrogenase (NAD+) catalytic subunit